MITEIGNFFLSISATFSLCLFSLIFFKKTVEVNTRIYFCKILSFSITFLILIAFSLLSYAFLNDDFSLRYVANNSNISLENIYKFSAVWGAHEGSILLWVFVLSLWCSSIILFSKNMSKIIIIDMLSVMGILLLFFLLFILFSSNPFDRIFPVPLNGNDLNPLLQDPGLIIHPPMLYLGYVGTSVPFVFAIAVLLNGKIQLEWLAWLRKWVISSWMFLTIGITLGSWWAYHELGWGGWWFWDPVENASFMPWLAITALMHSIIVSEKRGIFISWSILLAILTFSLSLLGTFLVRSGILVSVHAFANDPERGLYILTFLTLIIGSSLYLYFLKSRFLVSEKYYSVTSKEFILLLNNLFLTVTTFAILLGTLYPLITSSLNLGKISVGAPYFNFIFSALTLPIVLLMSPAIYTRWKETNYNLLIKRLGPILIFSIIISYVYLHFYYKTDTFIVYLAMSLAFFTILSSLLKFKQVIINGNGKNIFNRVFKGNSTIMANLLSHIGIGFLIIGITISNYYSIQKEIVMYKNSEITIKNVSIKFVDVQNKLSKNYTSQVGIFDAYLNNKYLISFFPEKRTYNVQKNIMTEAAISSTLFRDIYVALGEKISSDSWVVRIYYKPYIQLLWIGAILMILGGMFGILGRNKLVK
jgi:cytochrome c-type biogenesis protein CcmF